jgi:cellulose biosynthesis protein BcsQ
LPLVVVASGKGGVTKTTTAYALAAAVKELGEEPKLLDLDPGASLTENAGLQADGRHALDLLEGRGALGSLLVQTVDEIPLVPGTADILAASSDRAELFHYARNLVAAAEEELLIVDTAQGLGLPATRAALLAADFIIVPMQAEPAVIKRSYPDVLALLRHFRADPELASSFRLRPALLFVLTKVNTRLSLTHHELDKLAKEGVQIAAYIPAGVAAAESCLTGQSVITYAPRSPISNGYRDLARTLVATMNSRKLELTVTR